LIGSALAAESQSSRQLSTEVYLTRIQTGKDLSSLSQAILFLSLCFSLSLSLSLSRFLGVDPSLPPS